MSHLEDCEPNEVLSLDALYEDGFEIVDKTADGSLVEGIRRGQLIERDWTDDPQ